MSCPTLCDPMGHSPPGCSVHDIPRQEFWNGWPLPSPRDLTDPGIKPISPELVDELFSTESPGKLRFWILCKKEKQTSSFPHESSIQWLFSQVVFFFFLGKNSSLFYPWRRTGKIKSGKNKHKYFSLEETVLVKVNYSIHFP